MGNPEFARYHLEKIVGANFNIVAVISAPDKPGGRGLQLQETPVTTYAKSMNIPCLQPKNLKNEAFLKTLKDLDADIQIVIAFRMLPKVVWNMPAMGTINLHASLLPQYRGAAPINWAIINGEKTTGVTTFRLQHEIDTGGILLQKECSIEPQDNAGTLHDKLMVLGANTMIETLEKLFQKTLHEKPQIELKQLKSAPKLYTQNTTVDWNQKGQDILNFIRGLNPYPSAHYTFNGKKMQIFEARFYEKEHKKERGLFFSDQKKYIAVSVLDGYVYLECIKLQGKRKMNITDFLNGYNTTDLLTLKL